MFHYRLVSRSISMVFNIFGRFMSRVVVTIEGGKGFELYLRCSPVKLIWSSRVNVVEVALSLCLSYLSIRCSQQVISIVVLCNSKPYRFQCARGKGRIVVEAQSRTIGCSAVIGSAVRLSHRGEEACRTGATYLSSWPTTISTE